MARLHIRFRNINKRTVRATQTLFDSKPWSGTEEEQQSKFERWLRTVSEIYSIPQPTLTVTEESDVFGLVAPNTIVLDKYSVTSLFHSFRAHMQYAGAVESAFYDRSEAQAWACSLFYTCRPILFRKQVRAGRISGVHSDDLLSSATLASRQDEVDETFSGIVAENFSDDEVEDDHYFSEDEDASGLPTDEQVDAAVGGIVRCTVSEAAQRLNVSESTVRNMLRDGRLAGEQDGRRVYVLLDASA